jgi:hypothetical protein
MAPSYERGFRAHLITSALNIGNNIGYQSIAKIPTTEPRFGVLRLACRRATLARDGLPLLAAKIPNGHIGNTNTTGIVEIASYQKAVAAKVGDSIHTSLNTSAKSKPLRLVIVPHGDGLRAYISGNLKIATDENLASDCVNCKNSTVNTSLQSQELSSVGNGVDFKCSHVAGIDVTSATEGTSNKDTTGVTIVFGGDGNAVVNYAWSSNEVGTVDEDRVVTATGCTGFVVLDKGLPGGNEHIVVHVGGANVGEGVDSDVVDASECATDNNGLGVCMKTVLKNLPQDL